MEDSRFLQTNRHFYRYLFLLTGMLMGSVLYSQDPLKIVPIGNSITHGYIWSDGANSYRRNLWNKLINASYNVDFVGSLDTDKNGYPFPDASFDHDHEGHWGWRADEIVANLSGWLSGYTPEVALIHIGTNDVIQNNDVASTLEEIEDIIGILRNDNSQITIFLAQILPLADSERNARVDGINSGLVSLASSLDQSQSRIILVDQNSGWIIDSHTYDGVHPNTDGEERMAQRWFSAFDAFYSSANEPPEITGQNSLSVDEDQLLSLTVSDFTITDPDNDPSDMTLLLTDGSHYSVSGTTITPETDWSGTLTVPVRVSDGISESGTFNASVTVAPVNDAPVISGQSTLEMSEGSSLELTLSQFTYNDVDNPGGPFTLTAHSGSNYTLDGNIVLPNSQFHGTLSVPVTISDGSATSDPFNAQVSVTEVNEPPVITGQTVITTGEDQPLTLAVSDFIISDPDNDPGDMTLLLTDGSHYSVSGTTITPEMDWYGTLTVPVRISDGVSESGTFNASVTVAPVNDAPVIALIPDQTISHGEKFDSIKLDDYVNDIETHDSDIVWSVSGNLNLEIEILDQVARITVADENWYGTEAIKFTATDIHSAGALSDSYEATFTVEAPVSAPLSNIFKVDIYADPLTDLLSIKTAKPRRLSISIYAMNGQSILTRELTGSYQYINLSPYPDGIYFITLSSKDFVTTRKIIKL